MEQEYPFYFHTAQCTAEHKIWDYNNINNNNNNSNNNSNNNNNNYYWEQKRAGVKGFQKKLMAQ